MLDLSREFSRTPTDVEILCDRDVPGMGDLLDARRVASHPRLQELWGDKLTCQITYVRYKPATNCLIAYAITTTDTPDVPTHLCYAKCFSEAEYETAAAKVAHHRWVESSDTPPAILLPESHAIIYIFPNDTHLDGLRILATPKKIQRALYAHDSDYPEDTWRISDRRLRVTAVRYKPERRAVLKLDTRAVHRETGERRPLQAYMSIFTDDRGQDIFRTMAELHEFIGDIPNVITPRPYAFVKERSALLVQGLPGAPAPPGQHGFDSGTVAQTAHALAAVHGWDGGSLHTEGIPEFAERIHSTARMLSQIASAMAADAHRTAELLTARLSEVHSEVVRFVHGDFYHGQILFGGPQVAIVAFERSYRGDPAADVGNYCAHLRLAGLNGAIANETELIARFVHEYRAAASVRLSAPALRFWTALGLYLLAVRPFRTLDPHWRQRIEQILELCTELAA